ncbi:hypothetical protein L1887_07961 [Cichorium endivia]|nr:hypothetical protein L1887_07961 [Cichorium endivia]
MLLQFFEENKHVGPVAAKIRSSKSGSLLGTSQFANEGNSENMKDDLSGLDKAMGCVPRQRTIDCNQLLVSVAKSKLSKTRDEKNEKVTKPEELVRLNDLLLQNTADLADMLRSGRDRKEKWRYLKNVNSKA